MQGLPSLEDSQLPVNGSIVTNLISMLQVIPILLQLIPIFPEHS